MKTNVFITPSVLNVALFTMLFFNIVNANN